ncbi:PIG-L family deacetylase [Kerstersia gyiorum]|jgi:LmbE family N-acetylglucosaminyl deacetylase|uniref:PIG-L family deacetylase n=1 Tax=Kerstersia gyiorum TaxID=206506 RepID=UPI0024322087|nr:PIG-L family deacetylase [Kerstersia gyiorum]MCH4272891.1 PIG-L family deacetylase [Kerstersia gyiorum]MCI1229563.1 PIG-L family deacetylase [Kerstersia gyiorum]
MPPSLCRFLPRLTHRPAAALLLALGIISCAQAALPDPAVTAPTPPASLPAAWTGAGDTNCHGIRDLAFVAHMDDDLLFMNPDLQAVSRAGACLTVVYLTASERDEGVAYMLSRERAVRAAHAYMAGQDDLWTEDRVLVSGHVFARQRLQGQPGLQLLHMRLRDPWLGPGWGSLTPLSQLESVGGHAVETLGDFQERYDREELVRTLAAVIQAYQPTTIRHLDDTSTIPYTSLCWRCAGHGHPDHIASARLVREAMRQLPDVYPAVGYVDYPSQEREANLAPEDIRLKTESFLRYAWLDRRYCAQGQQCRQPYGPTAAWVERSYYLSRHDTPPALAEGSQDSLVLATTSEWSNQPTTWTAQQERWQPLGKPSAEAPQAFTWPDGAAGLLLRDALGTLWSSRQDPASGHWQRWQALHGMRFRHAPALAAQGNGALALGNDGQLYWSQARPAAAGLPADWQWQEWQALPPLPGASIHAALLQDKQGRLQAFALDLAGQLYRSNQEQPGSPAWQAWQPLAAPASNGGLAALAHDEALEVFLRGKNGELYHIVRPGADAPWQPAEPLALHYIGQPAVGLDEDGDVVVAALERAGGPVWVLDEDEAPVRLMPAAGSAPALQRHNGALHLAARRTGATQAYDLWRRDPADDSWKLNATATLPIPPAAVSRR